jgi:CheY-like chemotaxis protein
MASDGARVLVVEDDVGIRSFLADLLGDEGYQVREAEDGRAALPVLEAWRPDLIVLDLMMPNLDGFGFRAAQREQPETREIPVVVVTARQKLGAAELAELAPAAVLAKPFDAAALLGTIAEIVSRR